jgi:hypothetical protein
MPKKLLTTLPCIMHKVESSNIAEIGYSPKENLLIIKFHTGVYYSYINVPVNVWYELKGSKSIGAYFHNHIKTNKDYKYTREIKLK